MTNKVPIDISSSTVNKLIDVAKDFLDVIAKPGAKQIGLMIEEKVQSYRIMNQVQILLKVKDYVEKRGVSLSAIPLKILVPLLDHASLEEEEELQDIWAKMLTNMLDSAENFQKHIFPYILSQMSIEDYRALNELNEKEEVFWAKYRSMVNNKNYIKEDGSKVEWIDLRNEIKEIEQTGFFILDSDNLQRLGLIRELPPSIVIPEFEKPNTHGNLYFSIEAKYQPDDYGYRMTDLGYSFIKVCKFKEQESENKN